MVTAIILSKDRPAQLHLLLASIRKNAYRHIHPVVIYKGDRDLYRQAAPDVLLIEETNLEQQIRDELELSADYVCFMADDGILYRPYRGGAENVLHYSPDTLCVSLRLGFNTLVCQPTGIEQTAPESEHYDWTTAQGDFAYPGSIDAHIFRRCDLVKMLRPRSFPNPTALECVLVEACEERLQEQPKMAMYSQSLYVGNPINRTSEQSNVRYGDRYPVTVAECLNRFEAGWRIDLERLSFDQVDGAHTEIELIWG